MNFGTTAQQQPVNQLSSTWAQLRQPPSGAKVFEQAERAALDITKDHVLLYSSTSTSVRDADVPSQKESASNWDGLVAAVPGMQPHMVAVADLLGKTDPYLTEVINCKLEERSLAPINHVSDLFRRVGNKYMSTAERTDNMAVVSEFLEDFGATEVVPQQWCTVMSWWSKRVMSAHPLGSKGTINSDVLDQLAQSVESDDSYANIRDAAQLMIRAALRVLAAPQQQ